MSSTDPQNAHPRFGFTPQRMTTSLTDSSLTGAAFDRPAGMTNISAVGVFTLTGGTGQVNVAIQASNDGVGWTSISSLPSTLRFTATATRSLFQPVSVGGIPVDRFSKLRFLATADSGTPVFTLEIAAQGISRDSEIFRPDSFSSAQTVLTRASATESSSEIVRPAGVRYASVMLVPTNVALGAASSFLFVVQGSLDEGATWQTIPSGGVAATSGVSITGNIPSFYDGKFGTSMVDLSGYDRLRFQVTDVGGAGTSYTITVHVCMDSVDWSVDDNTNGDLTISRIAGYFQVLSLGAEAANAIVATCRVVGISGVLLGNQFQAQLYLSNLSGCGLLNLSGNGTFTAVGGGGSALSPTGASQIIVNPGSDGEFTVTITDAVVEAIYLGAITAQVANQDGQGQGQGGWVFQSEEQTVTFA